MSTALQLLEAQPLLLDKYAYGTAGFRYKAEVMPCVMLRVGLVARFLLDGVEEKNNNNSNTNNNMGVMVTASHNDESYNGVKISNPDGSMISSQQEELLVKWVNERDLSQWKHVLSSASAATTKNSLHIGYDTRGHSVALTNLLIQGAQARHVKVQNHGILTTPMLHHIVLHSNPHLLPVGTKPAPTRSGYLTQLAESYNGLVRALELDTATTNSPSVLPSLQVDGACGVGYQASVELQQALENIDAKNYANRFQPRNPPGSGPLNTNCGSEHVQKQLVPPTWYEESKDDDMAHKKAKLDTSYSCSFDGDADRIVFFSQPSTSASEFVLLDGDKIAVLIAHFLGRQQALRESAELSMGVVQTAYANGASTKYLKSLNIPVVITKTGVKHLHHAALQFDVGVYFEANGHGTVLFSTAFHAFAQKEANQHKNPLYSLLPQLINPAVGDALSDMLIVDLLLRYLGWSLDDWANIKLYQDLPSRQLKVKVQDRSLIVCNDNETKCLEPVSVQPALEKLMASTDQGRAFIRPSGTENVVRIYAEASTRAAADQLASQTAQLVHEHCYGIGPLPKI